MVGEFCNYKKQKTLKMKMEPLKMAAAIAMISLPLGKFLYHARNDMTPGPYKMVNFLNENSPFNVSKYMPGMIVKSKSMIIHEIPEIDGYKENKFLFDHIKKSIKSKDDFGIFVLVSPKHTGKTISTIDTLSSMQRDDEITGVIYFDSQGIPGKKYGDLRYQLYHSLKISQDVPLEDLFSKGTKTKPIVLVIDSFDQRLYNVIESGKFDECKSFIEELARLSNEKQTFKVLVNVRLIEVAGTIFTWGQNGDFNHVIPLGQFADYNSALNRFGIHYHGTKSVET